MSKRIDLLNGNILGSVTRLALPLMGMSFLQMTYNLTDLFWIGKMGAGAVAAVGTGGLILWGCMSIHMLSRIGGQIYVAQTLGAGKNELAGEYAHAAIFLNLVIAAIIGFVFLFFTKNIISFFSFNGAEVIKQAEDYIRIAAGFIVFSLTSKLLISLITTTGDSKTPFIATASGLVFNIILDPILIFGYCGFPALGALGAAIATVLAQFIVFLVLLIHVMKDKHLFAYINMKKLPDFYLCKRILKLSAPVAIQNMLYACCSIYIARVISSFGDNAMAVQRLGAQIESISWMTSEGFSSAIGSFVGQNYGAGNIKRAKEGFYKGLAVLSVIGVVATITLVFGAEKIFSVFVDEAPVIKMGVDYLVIVGLSQLFQCVEILSGGTLNAFSKTFIPASISIVFTCMRIPAAIILGTTTLGICGIWWSISVSTMIKGVLLILLVLVFFKTELKQIEERFNA